MIYDKSYNIFMKALKEKSSIFTLLQIIAAVAFTCSSFGPGIISVCLVLLVAFTLVLVLKESKHPYFDFFIFGLVFHVLAFYWLPQTISFFGGFGDFLAYLIFILYCFSHSLQFLLVVFLFKRLNQTILGKMLLAFPLAWLFAEYFFPRMFPWSLANPMISLIGFSSWANVVGVFPLSALLLWWASLVLAKKKISFIFVILVLFYNFPQRIYAGGNYKKVAVIQANINAKDVINPDLRNQNLQLYQNLSKEVKDADLIIWPESSANYWIPDEIVSLKNTKFDPLVDRIKPMIFGSMSYQAKDSKTGSSNDLDYYKYNTVFAVDQAGTVLGNYHKQILMPFGEYMPFADLIPVLKNLSPETGDFTFGGKQSPIEIKNFGLRIGSLICYEDLVSLTSVDAVRAGANILINFSNDAWYGNTKAVYQHNLLAAWRAIETKRYLIRSTNTGYTTIIDPFGKIESDLEAFKSGILEQSIAPLEEITFYVKHAHIFPWLTFSLVLIFLLISYGQRGSNNE